MKPEPIFTLEEVLAIVEIKRPYATIPACLKKDREQLAQRFKEIAAHREATE
jgi:hypothetical protein